MFADPALLEAMVGGGADEAGNTTGVLPRAAAHLGRLAGQALRPPHRPHLALLCGSNGSWAADGDSDPSVFSIHPCDHHPFDHPQANFNNRRQHSSSVHILWKISQPARNTLWTAY